MKTIEVTLHRYDELSDKAKLKALIDYQSDCEYSWSREAIDSLDRFMTAVGVEMTDYQLDWLCPSRSNVRYEGTPHGESIKEELTGVFSDYALTTTWNKTRSIEDAVEAFLSEMCKDYEYQLSEENYAEMCETIDLWFDEDGNQIY